MIGNIFIGIVLSIIGLIIGYLYAQGKSRLKMIELSNKLQEESKLHSHFEALASIVPKLEKENYELRKLESRLAESEMARKKDAQAAIEKLALLEEAKQTLTEAFGDLSRKALSSNSQDFLKLAKSELDRHQESAKKELEHRQISIQELVRPINESLSNVDRKIQEIEKTRVGAYESLTSQVSSLLTETTKLSRAMHSSQTRGHWGEIQLKRVVEMAGMLEHCDFTQQESKN